MHVRPRQVDGRDVIQKASRCTALAVGNGFDAHLGAVRGRASTNIPRFPDYGMHCVAKPHSCERRIIDIMGIMMGPVCKWKPFGVTGLTSQVLRGHEKVFRILQRANKQATGRECVKWDTQTASKDDEDNRVRVKERILSESMLCHEEERGRRVLVLGERCRDPGEQRRYLSTLRRSMFLPVLQALGPSQYDEFGKRVGQMIVLSWRGSVCLPLLNAGPANVGGGSALPGETSFERRKENNEQRWVVGRIDRQKGTCNVRGTKKSSETFASNVVLLSASPSLCFALAVCTTDAPTPLSLFPAMVGLARIGLAVGCRTIDRGGHGTIEIKTMLGTCRLLVQNLVRTVVAASAERAVRQDLPLCRTHIQSHCPPFPPNIKSVPQPWKTWLVVLPP